MSATARAVPNPYADMTLREIVRDALTYSHNPDPNVVVDHVLGLLDADQIEEAARLGLRGLARAEVGHHKAKAFRRPSPPKPGAKYARAARAVKAHPDIFLARVVVGVDEHGKNIHKFLRDCDKAELNEAARLLREQGAALLDAADRYERLAKKLRGQRTVGTLKREVVEQVVWA